MTIFFNINRFFRSVIFVLFVFFLASGFVSKTSMASVKNQSKLTSLYEYWNPRTKDHKYTTTYKGRISPGYRFKGVICKVATTESKENTPFLEYWNQTIGDHYYTASWLGLSFGDCHYQSIVCYVEKTKNNLNKALHEYWNQSIGDHLYTTTYKGEVFGGYEYSGIACYVK